MLPQGLFETCAIADIAHFERAPAPRAAMAMYQIVIDERAVAGLRKCFAGVATDIAGPPE
jgi:hypothetical protein